MSKDYIAHLKDGTRAVIDADWMDSSGQGQVTLYRRLGDGRLEPVAALNVAEVITVAEADQLKEYVKPSRVARSH